MRRQPGLGPTRRPDHHRPVTTGLVTGAAMLALAGLVGWLLSGRPAANLLDNWGFAVLPARLNSPTYHDIAVLGSGPVFAGGILVAALLSLRHDLARALACLLGPLLAVLLTEVIVKPLVARHAMLGGYSYPSGTVTTIAALAAVAFLVARPGLRPMVAGLGVVAVVAVAVAVVGMRWHYPTDALGGALVGSGSVILVDGLLHLRGPRRRTRPVAAPGPAIARPGPSAGRLRSGLDEGRSAGCRVVLPTKPTDGSFWV